MYNIFIIYMNHFFSFHNKKFYFRLPEKKIIYPNRNIIRKYFVKPRHSFRQGLLTRLANPASCGCGK